MDVLGHKGGGKQDKQQKDKNDVGEGIKETLVDAQQHHAEQERCANPHNLHAGSGGKVEELLGLPELIGCAANAHPAQPNQNPIKDDRRPVE